MHRAEAKAQLSVCARASDAQKLHRAEARAHFCSKEARADARIWGACGWRAALDSGGSGARACVRNTNKMTSTSKKVAPRRSESAILSIHTRIRYIKKAPRSSESKILLRVLDHDVQRQQSKATSRGPLFEKRPRSGATRAKKMHRAEARAHPATRG